MKTGRRILPLGLLSFMFVVGIVTSSFRGPITYKPFDFQDFIAHYNLDDSLVTSLEGKPVLIEFWASWCAPCRVKNAELLQVYERVQQDSSLDFEIISVSLDSDSLRWRKAIRNDDLVWSIQLREEEGYGSAYLKSIYVQSLPQNVLINRNGKMEARNLETSTIKAYLDHKY